MARRRGMLDDVARLATGAVGIVLGAGREAEVLLRQRMERVLDRMDLVSREEFEAVKAMAQAAREENERLAARLDALEGKRAPARPAARRQTQPRKAGTGLSADGAAPKAPRGSGRAPRGTRKKPD